MNETHHILTAEVPNIARGGPMSRLSALDSCARAVLECPAIWPNIVQEDGDLFIMRRFRSLTKLWTESDTMSAEQVLSTLAAVRTMDLMRQWWENRR
jgi:hypothetical protein